MHSEQGSRSAGDAGGPVSRQGSQVDRRLAAAQTGGSTCDGPGRQHGGSGFAHRCAVWAPFDEWTHLHARAGPRGKEPPLLLAFRCLATSGDASVHLLARWTRPRHAGLAPAPLPGLVGVDMVGGGQCFAVTRRTVSAGTDDFDWICHCASLRIHRRHSLEWKPGQGELTEEVRSFLAEFGLETGYQADRSATGSSCRT